MKIYGRSLSEVFSLLPWPYKLVVTLGTAFVIFAVPYSLSFFSNMGIAIERIEPLTFPGLNRQMKGILDPAMASDGRNVMMVHTVMGTISPPGGGAEQLSMDTMIERAEAPCRTWMTAMPAFASSTADDVAVGYGRNAVTLPPGVWRNETPGAVYDPDDKGNEWKVYAYRYFWMGDEKIARILGMIVERSAHDILGPWGRERFLFSAGPVQMSDGVHQQPPAPFSEMVEIKLNTLSPELADVYFYSRPSVIYVRKFLFMTLSAFTTSSKTPDRIVMLYSTDHGRNWRYAGTPLRQQDLAKMGDYTSLGGASLIQYNDRIFLSAVLGNKTADGLGAFIIPFDSIVKGTLARDAKGAPIVEKHHPRNSIQPSKMGGGYAAYSDFCKQGMIMSEYSDVRDSFQIFKTWKKPVD